MSAIRFMNVPDALTSEVEKKKYPHLRNRSAFLVANNDVGVVASKPSDDYIHNVHQGVFGNRYVSQKNFITINPSDPYNNLSTKLRELGNFGSIQTFIVSDAAFQLAYELGLTTESTPESIAAGNCKLKIFDVIKAIPGMEEHVMSGENITVTGMNYQKFYNKLYEISEGDDSVWIKFPESVAGNGVFKISLDKHEDTQKFWDKHFQNGTNIPGMKDGKIMIQRNIPHLVGFYNVMTDVGVNGNVGIVGSGVTKQILKGESHIGNNQILGNMIDGEYKELPSSIREKMLALAKEISTEYYKKFTSMGKSGIDFAVSFIDGEYKIRVMEVNDRMNGCYSLHHAHTQLKNEYYNLSAVSIPIGFQKPTREKADSKIFTQYRQQLITPEKLVQWPKNKDSLILPIAFNNNSYQVLIATNPSFDAGDMLNIQEKFRSEIQTLLS